MVFNGRKQLSLRANNCDWQLSPPLYPEEWVTGGDVGRSRPTTEGTLREQAQNRVVFCLQKKECKTASRQKKLWDRSHTKNNNKKSIVKGIKGTKQGGLRQNLGGTNYPYSNLLCTHHHHHHCYHHHHFPNHHQPSPAALATFLSWRWWWQQTALSSSAEALTHLREGWFVQMPSSRLLVAWVHFEHHKIIWDSGAVRMQAPDKAMASPCLSAPLAQWDSINHQRNKQTKINHKYT